MTVIRSTSLFLCSTLFLFAPLVSADPLTLVEGFNVLVRHDMTLKADVGGRTAVGGNATFTSFAIGSGDGSSNGAALAANPARLDLVVGGHASLTNGSVNKGSAIAGSATTSGAGFPTAGSSLTTGAAPIDFADTFANLAGLSSDLYGVSGNGTALNQWGGLTLTGTDTTLNVFTITTAMLSGLNTVNINVPMSSTVLFNVTGASLTMQYLGINVNGQQNNAMSDRMLWNFGELSSLTLNGLGWRGSILAPMATMNFANGNVNGQVMVNNLYTSWGGEYHNFAFAGDLPVGDATDPPPTPGAPVPEPSTLLLLGLAGIVVVGRCFRRASA